MSTARFTHRPGVVFRTAAMVMAVLTVAIAAPRSTLALAAGVVGVGGLVAGLTRSDPRLAALGPLALLASVLAAGAVGAPPAVILPSIATALLAWDFAANAFAAVDELGDGRVERAEAFHVITTTGVGVLGVGVAYGLFRLLSFGPSLTGVALLFVAAAALAGALRE